MNLSEKRGEWGVSLGKYDGKSAFRHQNVGTNRIGVICIFLEHKRHWRCLRGFGENVYGSFEFSIVDQQRLFMKVVAVVAILDLKSLQIFVARFLQSWSDCDQTRYRRFPQKMYLAVANFMKIGAMVAILDLRSLQIFVARFLQSWSDCDQTRYRRFPQKCI
jgi:uncharacterized protein YlbG (UPF0298 family)